MQNWKNGKDQESKFTEQNNGQKYFQLQKSKLCCQHGHLWEELYAFRGFCIYIAARNTYLLCHVLRPSVSICPFVCMY